MPPIDPTAIPVVYSNYLMFCRIKPWVGSGAHRRATAKKAKNSGCLGLKRVIWRGCKEINAPQANRVSG